MRWKALQFLEKLESKGKQTFGFKSTKFPPAIGPFEWELQRLIRNIEFRPIRNKFLSKLINDDTSKNIYMSKEDYQKHLRNKITKTYKKSNRSRVNDINLYAK